MEGEGTALRARASAAEWAKRVQAWKSSGASAERFATAHGWSWHTLRWWAARLKQPTSTTAGARRATALGFVRLVAAKAERPAPSDAALLEVVTATGRTVRVRPGVDIELLRQVVEALER